MWSGGGWKWSAVDGEVERESVKRRQLSLSPTLTLPVKLCSGRAQSAERRAESEGQGLAVLLGRLQII